MAGSADCGIRRSWWRRLLPGVDSLTRYERVWLRGDVLAGITVAAYLVPQVMAYAEVAGLPAVVGLWAVLVALLLYAVFGSSRQLSVGPTASACPCIMERKGFRTCRTSLRPKILAALPSRCIGGERDRRVDGHRDRRGGARLLVRDQLPVGADQGRLRRGRGARPDPRSCRRRRRCRAARDRGSDQAGPR